MSKPPGISVYFNNGWDGFALESLDDVLFQLRIDEPTALLGYIVIRKELKPEMFTSSVAGLLAVADSSPEPYEDGALLEMLVCSDSQDAQSSDDYEWLFEHYAPFVPGDVSVDVCDGNSQAQWLWSCLLPAYWLEPSPPFVKETFWPELRSLLNAWLSAHNRAISRIPPRPAA